MKRLAVVAFAAVILAGCYYVPPPTTIYSGPRQFCFGEGGRVDECVSTANPGQP